METGLTWKAKPWSQLDRDELHALLRLRIDVFVLEQECPYSELDGKDLRSIHVWASDTGGGQGRRGCVLHTRSGARGQLQRAQHRPCGDAQRFAWHGLGQGFDAPQLGRLRA